MANGEDMLLKRVESELFFALGVLLLVAAAWWEGRWRGHVPKRVESERLLHSGLKPCLLARCSLNPQLTRCPLCLAAASGVAWKSCKDTSRCIWCVPSPPNCSNAPYTCSLGRGVEERQGRDGQGDEEEAQAGWVLYSCNLCYAAD